MRVLFFFFMYISFLYSQEVELDNLLKEYGNAEELYLKSKKESAGHVIVYSRADLDKMQAYSLNDVLKTLRMYTLQITANGMTTLVKAGANQMSISPVKIYINRHELNSVTLGNALSQYGKMSLYFIDHIEIYQASNSVTFGNEPANTIIKLYTKNPSRENGVSTQFSVDNKGSLNLRAVTAREYGDYSYLVNVDASKNNFNTYVLKDTELSHDGTRGQFYFNFSKNDSYNIEIGATDEKYDMLKGLGSSPTDGEIHTNNGYLQASKYFDDDLSVTLSFSHEKLIFTSSDADGIRLYDASSSNLVESTIKTKIYDVMVDKKIKLGPNDISMGLQLKYKEFFINEFKSDNIDIVLPDGSKKKNMFVGYIEDLYSINENNIITISGKLNYTKDDYAASTTNHIFRIGYVSTINENLLFKFFAIKGYLTPTFRQTTFSPSYNINPDLETAYTRTTTAEAIYKIGASTFTFGGGSSETYDAILFDATQNKYVNSQKKGYLSRVYTKLEHKFNIDNKLVLDLFKMYTKNEFSPTHGLLIQSFNKIGKIEIYNELVYRSSYTSVDGTYISEGYNYSLGLIYPISKKMDLKLKGENLLDRATEVPVGDITIPAVDKRALVTMEYTF